MGKNRVEVRYRAIVVQFEVQVNRCQACGEPDMIGSYRRTMTAIGAHFVAGISRKS